nr:hypothetical protein [Nitrosomonas nitrosa]
MTNKYENQVRREQLKLLRFEKVLRSLAPAAIATGLTVTGIQEAHAQRATLNTASAVFAEMDSESNVSDFITQSVKQMDALIARLSVSNSLQERRSAMLELMEVVDSAHQAAQDSSYRKSVRLIGERRRGNKVDGGTPKVNNNVAWLIDNLVDGGTPKVSANAAWLRSKFGI